MDFNKNFYTNFFDGIYQKIVIFVLCTFLFSGCGKDVSILRNEAMEEPSMTEQQGNTDRKEEQVDEQEKSEDSEVVLIYVDLGGAVENPGVYTLPVGSRVFQLIELAGGFSEDAYIKQINQADVLSDGEKIYVYTIEEAEELLSQGIISNMNILTDSDDHDILDKIDLNRANKEDLLTLPGIGETRAEAILQYRREHGQFGSIEELMQVEGIKQKTYEKIKDCITVQ